jgi:imidazolonepropionase-like amidohydrolase
MHTPAERAVNGSSLRLRGVHVVRVDTGDVLRDQVVDIADHAITAISPATGTAEAAADGVLDIDLGGRYLMPGLISVHTHLTAVYPFEEIDLAESADTSALRGLSRAVDALHAGVTTVRCLDEHNRADIAIRAAAAQGWVQAPRILAAGRAIRPTGGHGHGFTDNLADGYDEFLKAARSEFAAGADHVKIFITGGIAREGEDFVGSEMTPEEMAAVVRAAGERGKYVVAHAGHGPAIRQAISAGVRSFEHAYDVDVETARAMRQAGVFITPTLSVTHCPEWMAQHHFTPWQIQRATSVAPRHLESIRRIVEHGRSEEPGQGVTFVTGTDYPPGEPFEDTVCQVREMELMTTAGLTAAEVLRAATTDGAKLVGLGETIGRVELGFVADLVVCDDDPTIDISALRRIRMVIQEGRVVRDDLGLAAASPVPPPAG